MLTYSEVVEGRSGASRSLAELCSNMRKYSGPDKMAYLKLQVGPAVKISSEPRRIILTTNRKNASLSTELHRTCNGVVIDSEDWSLLAVPNPVLTTRYKPSILCANIDKYTIYPIHDGTTVTLYHYASNWRMSSSHGFDIGHFKWISSKTFMEAFLETAAMYPKFSLDKLNKSFSYTIGFRHNDFHPLLSDKPHMWVLNAFNLSAGTKSPSTDIGLPYQDAISTHLRGAQLFAWLSSTANDALDTFLATPANPPQYGFILRAKCDMGPASNILIESKLLSYIRHNIYEMPKKESRIIVNEQNRLEYMTLKSFLGMTCGHIFLKLFPQLSIYTEKYSRIFRLLTTKIVNALANREPSDVLKSLECPTNVDKLATQLIDHIKKHANVCASNVDSSSIVLDFLLNVEYLDLYFTCLA